jgi:hypothetical protein
VKRLDRVVANLEWSDTWRDAGVEVLAYCSSDHLPLLLTMNKSRACGKKNWRPFRFEAGWSKKWDFKKIIHEA